MLINRREVALIVPRVIVLAVVPQMLMISNVKKLATGPHAFVGSAAAEGGLVDGASGARLAAWVGTCYDLQEGPREIYHRWIVHPTN